MAFVSTFIDLALDAIPVAAVAVVTAGDTLQSEAQISLGNVVSDHLAHTQGKLLALLLGRTLFRAEEVLFMSDFKLFEVSLKLI